MDKLLWLLQTLRVASEPMPRDSYTMVECIRKALPSVFDIRSSRRHNGPTILQRSIWRK